MQVFLGDVDCGCQRNEMFFTKEKVKSIELEKRYKKQVTHTCDDCGAHKKCKSPKMLPTGGNDKNIYILAECPGAEEDTNNTQLIGESGQLLRSVLEENDIDLDSDCLKDNSCRCRIMKDGNNKVPSSREVSCCRSNILKTIEDKKPNKIILLGKTAVLSFLGHRTTNVGGITKWAGFVIPDQIHNCWVFPTFHPSFLLYDPDNIALDNLFRKHINTAINWNKPIPKYKNNVIMLNKLEEVISLLEAIKVLRKPFVFDYETTGLKPHKKGHKILCMSICFEEFQAYAFPFFSDSEFLSLIKDILTDDRIGKMAHNFKFENNWTRNILGYNVNNWIFDTMLAAHEIDNRSGITGLKFQTYVNFGTIGYDNEVHSYISAENGNDFNKLDKLPINSLLYYCGLDSLFTFLLYQKQKKIIKDWAINRKRTHRLFLDATKAFCDIEYNGFNIDSEYYLLQNKHLERRITRIYSKIQNSKEVELFGKKLNINSPKQLGNLLFDKLKYKTDKKTETGMLSTDLSVLQEINTEFTNNMLTYKKLYKLNNTYLAGFIKEGVGDKLYPVNSLNLARTFRSSCSMPNYQNIPIREKDARRLIRSGIVPRKGHQILGADFSAIEVRIGACAHKDPVMLKYIKDPTTDMHRDLAIQIFLVNEQQVTKNIRRSGKSDFIFPEFYGAYYVSCARNLWKTVQTEKTAEGVLLRIHLADKGIITYDDFESHVAQIEDDFWNKRFKIYTKWKKNKWDFYQKNGYITSLDGSVFSGLMSRNQVFDYDIQCDACHCLLYSMIELNKYLKENKMDTSILGQVHDEILFDVNPNELEDLLPIIKRIMCEDVREYYKWIIVPLTIEATITKVDGSWYDKEVIEI